MAATSRDATPDRSLLQGLPVDDELLLQASRVAPAALAAYIAVADELHFGRAGQRLRLDQARISRLVQQLETQWKVLLFDRSTRHVELTQEGVRHYPLAVEAVRALARVHPEVITLPR